MRRRALVAVAGAVVSGGCMWEESGRDETGDAEADAVVTMTDEHAFVPETVEIETGQTVAWENESSMTHTVTAYQDSLPKGADYFASGGFSREGVASMVYPVRGGIGVGEAFHHTFEVPGVYVYYSIPAVERGMGGEVVVR